MIRKSGGAILLTFSKVAPESFRKIIKRNYEIIQKHKNIKINALYSQDVQNVHQ